MCSSFEPNPARDLEIVDQSSWEGVWKTTWGEMRLVFDDGQFHGTYGTSQHALSENSPLSRLAIS